MNVLVIEDEVNIAKPLVRMLEKNSIAAQSVNDGLSGYLQARRGTFDVIVLDIMLPEMDGLTVLRKLREEEVFTPILLLTAKDSTEDKVRGLELGADDYLTKPFAMDEFIARVKALGRRQNAVFTSRVLAAGDILLDTSNATLTVGERSEVLSSREAGILEILLKNKGAIVSKEYLLDRVWGLESDVSDNMVEIYMHYLRKKLSDSSCVRIVTRRNLGYILQEEG